MSKLRKELKEDEDLLNMDFFNELFENDFLEEKHDDENLFDKDWLDHKSGCLSVEEFYFELTDTKSKKGLHSDFIHSLCFIDEKELYGFFDQDKIKNVFYSETEESVMFINMMLKKVTEISEKFSKELISCVNMILNIQDDENTKMIDFKAKLYLNILSRFIYSENEEISLLEKINTNETEMTAFFCKHLDTKIDFEDLGGHYNTIQSRIYYHYKHLAANITINKDGTVSKCVSDERAINIGKSIVSKKKFKNFLIKTLNNDMTFQGSSYPYCVSTTLSFVNIADLTLLNELKELLNKYNVYNVVKDEWYLERYPQFVELLKDMDMKIIKEEQKHLSLIVNTDNKKKVNNRL